MTQIHDNPPRYILEQTETKKGLFSKKEVIKYAIGDENQHPLTGYDYDEIEEYHDGYAIVTVRKGSPKFPLDIKKYLVDLNGKQVLTSYSDSHYKITPVGNFFQISLAQERGLISKNEQVLIKPKENNYLEIIQDIVLYGNQSLVSPDYNKLGIALLTDVSLKPVVPCTYNYVQYLWNREAAVGRYVVTTTRTPSSLTHDTVTKTAKAAFQIYSVDSGKPVCDLIFGDIKETKNGNYSALIYPNIRPSDLTHVQSAAEAFSGTGLLDFSNEKRITINTDYKKIN